jgi:hypothetical protein
MLDRFGQQTFVGGKRVAVQKLPHVPKQAATTVHRVKDGNLVNFFTRSPRPAIKKFAR